MRTVRVMRALVANDLAVEWARPMSLLASVTFGAASLVLIRLVLAPGADDDPRAVVAGLWIALTFASLLVIGRSVRSELGSGTWDLLMLAPVDRSVVFGAKCISSLLLELAVQLPLLILWAVLVGRTTAATTLLVGVVVVVTSAGYAPLGTLIATLSARATGSATLAPVLMLPAAMPLVIVGADAALQLARGASLDTGAVLFLAGYAATLMAVGAALFDEVATD